MMKVDLFNGLIKFEGSSKELKELLKMVPDMTDKLPALQTATNESVYVHQKKVLDAQVAAGMGPPRNPQGPGNPYGLAQ